MRRFALLALFMPLEAFGQKAPADEPASDTSEDADSKPKKGRIYDPWPRIPRPRDQMRLPDPRAAAEKATEKGTVEPVTPVEPATPVAPPRSGAPTDAQVTVAPATASPADEPAVTALPAAAPAPSTPFRTTSFALAPPPQVAPHEGLTLEVGAGVGWIHVADRYSAITSPQGVGGLSIGIGGWVEESFALTARLAGSSVPGSDGVVVAGFLGPSIQMWFTQRTWAGLGLGLATLGVDRDGTANDFSLDGFGVDLRLGHAFYAAGHHAFNLSAELTPSRVSETSYGEEISLSVTSISVLFGWQYL